MMLDHRGIFFFNVSDVIKLKNFDVFYANPVSDGSFAGIHLSRVIVYGNDVILGELE